MRDSYENVSPELKAAVQQWIALVLQPAKGVCKYSSYGLKHLFEHSCIGVSTLYLSDLEMQGALVAAGYEPVDTQENSCQFRVKTRSTIQKHSRKHDTCRREYTNYCICHLTPEQKQAYREVVSHV